MQELPKAQPAVVLVLKCLRRWGNGLKSHPTDWEKLGIEPATPGLQDIGLSPTPLFLSYPHKNNRFFFLLTTVYTPPHFKKCGVLCYTLHSKNCVECRSVRLSILTNGPLLGTLKYRNFSFQSLPQAHPA